MSILNNSIVPAGAADTGYTIDQSLRFNDDDSAYLNWTPSSAGNRKTWTWSGWFKRGNVNMTNTRLFSAGTSLDNGHQDNSTYCIIHSNVLRLVSEGSGTFDLRTTQLFRDPSAWYHIVLAVDTEQGTAANRVKIYINGSQITDFTTETYPAEDSESYINAANEHYIGRTTSSSYWDGYLAEVNFIDGQALSPSDFGETGTYGEWKPIEYTDTYGTNGFHLDFGNSELGADVSTADTFSDGSLIAKYELNGNANDTTGNHNAIATGITYTSGKYGQSAAFNNGDKVEIPSGVLPSGSDPRTVSLWFYLEVIPSYSEAFFTSGNSSAVGNSFVMFYEHGDKLSFTKWSGEVNVPMTLDTHTWYHFVCTYDGSHMQLFLNGLMVAEGGISLNTAQTVSTIGYSGSVNGSWNATNNNRVEHVELYNRALTSDEVESLYEGTFLGEDGSLNKNHWTPHNLSASDQMLDSPTNNFATLNPLAIGTNGVLSEGNLKFTATTTSNPKTYGTIAVSDLDFYAEVLFLASGYGSVGIISLVSTTSPNPTADGSDNSYRILTDGSKRKTVAGTVTTDTYGSSYGNGDIIGVKYTASSGSVEFLINNVSQGVAYTGITGDVTIYVEDSSTGGTPIWILNAGQDSSFAGNKTAQSNTDGNGYGDFYYSPPTDYLALCTQNLPDPAVIPSEHFNPVTYSGNSSTQSITGVGFQPDLVWMKERSGTNGHGLFDVIRGVQKSLASNTSSAEATETNALSAFDSGGWTMGGHGAWNESGKTYVAWNWKANGSDVLNENGTLDSQVSANQDAGFSIVSYTGNGTAGATVGHGLSKAPEMVIIKSRTNGSDWWDTYHKDIGATNAVFLNDNMASAVRTYWNNQHPSSSVVYLGSDRSANGSGEDFIGYAFHSVDGYSKVGSYTGNGSSDGTFVYTGFRPAYVMWKYAVGTTNWVMQDSARDSYNPGGLVLLPNTSAYGELDYTSGYLDFHSNGFKLRGDYGTINGSGGTYIYIAFAEYPFKYTNAR